MNMGKIGFFGPVSKSLLPNFEFFCIKSHRNLNPSLRLTVVFLFTAKLVKNKIFTSSQNIIISKCDHVIHVQLKKKKKKNVREIFISKRVRH